MATTSVHSIYSTQAEALEYIVNPQKTESGLFVTSYGCSDDPKEAAEIFEATRNSIGTGRTSVLARHIHQSFAPGEITPEEAFRLGQKLCEKLFDFQYQYVLATHIDKEHIHNHIIANNVNLCNGLSLNYLTDKGKDNQLFQKIRDMSDEICRENNLSVIEDPELGKGQKWYEWSQDKQGLSWKSKLKYEIDCLIMRSENFDDFLQKCTENNIEVKYNPAHKIDLKFRMEGQEKYPDGKVPGEEVLTEKRNALIEQRNKSNAEYKEVKSKLKDVDYARKAIDDYLRNQRDVQQKKRKKGDLE